MPGLKIDPRRGVIRKPLCAFFAVLGVLCGKKRGLSTRFGPSWFEPGASQQKTPQEPRIMLGRRPDYRTALRHRSVQGH